MSFNFSTPGFYEAYQTFLAIGSSLSEHLSTQDLLALVDQSRQIGLNVINQPFIFVEGSSGSGKTQMVFSLNHILGGHEKFFFYLLASR
jgi:hypothetical protein